MAPPSPPVNATVSRPRVRAVSNAPSTFGERPLVEMPIVTPHTEAGASTAARSCSLALSRSAHSTRLISSSISSPEKTRAEFLLRDLERLCGRRLEPDLCGEILPQGMAFPVRRHQQAAQI